LKTTNEDCISNLIQWLL